MSELFFDVLEQPISTATIVSLAQSCAEQLAEVLHDETGLSIAGKRHWVHFSATPFLTHYEAHAKCGKQALDGHRHSA